MINEVTYGDLKEILNETYEIHCPTIKEIEDDEKNELFKYVLDAMEDGVITKNEYGRLVVNYKKEEIVFAPPSGKLFRYMQQKENDFLEMIAITTGMNKNFFENDMGLAFYTNYCVTLMSVIISGKPHIPSRASRDKK